MTQDLQLLKEVLSVPTKTYQEDLMVQFLVNWLTENNIEHFVDEHKNVYATKQESSELSEDFYFPCVVAHTDTVHNIDTINVHEEMLPNTQGELKLSYKAYNNQDKPTGIGGDDKCGVFACLTLLKELPYLKAAFFVSEETGCHGSLKAKEEFFTNVGYGIQFDAPENVLTEGMVNENMQYMVHPYTDVYALRGKFDFSCINFSIGYYNYHTSSEYVVVEDVFNGINMGRKMIKNLGYKLHYKEAKQYDWRHRNVF